MLTMNKAGYIGSINERFSQQAALELAKQFVEEVKTKGFHVRHAILFGSYARNEQHEWSDIDVALVADEFQSFPLLDSQLFKDIRIKKPYLAIESHTYNTDYFEKGDAFINEEIKPKGINIILFCYITC